MEDDDELALPREQKLGRSTKYASLLLGIRGYRMKSCPIASQRSNAMKPCDLPPVVFVQGWLMILAGIHQHLADDALHSAICRTIFVVSANPRFEMNEELATELVSLQLMALAKKSAGSELSEFCQRSLRVLLKDAMLDN